MGALTTNKTSGMLNTSANNAHILYMCTSYTPQICTVRMHTHYILVQCSIVVAVVVMVVVSQVTAQSSKTKREKNSVTRANHAHRFLLAKRAW